MLVFNMASGPLKIEGLINGIGENPKPTVTKGVGGKWDNKLNTFFPHEGYTQVNGFPATGPQLDILHERNSASIERMGKSHDVPAGTTDMLIGDDTVNPIYATHAHEGNVIE